MNITLICEYYTNFCSPFQEFLQFRNSVNFSKIYKKLLTIIPLILFWEPTKFCWLFSLNFSAIQHFSTKIARNKLLWYTLIKFAGSTRPETINKFLVNSKKTSSTSNLNESVLELKILYFLLPLLYDNQKRSN